MKNRKQLACILFISLFSLPLLAQETTSASGGEALGSGGTVSYSVGQISFSTVAGTTGTVLEGVQQPYEIYTVGLDELGIHVEINAFPNPTTDHLIITSTMTESQLLELNLFDEQGKRLLSQRITQVETILQLDQLTPATYFLKVTDQNLNYSTLKIIKK